MRSSPEFDLIARIRERFWAIAATGTGPAGTLRLGPGDDAAITVPPGATATSVDAMVEGVHFRSRWCDPRSVGHRATGAALSDLAAMGARAGEAYAWLGRPESLGEAECLALAEGMVEVCARHGVELAGGDLTDAPALAVCLTVVGHAERAEELVGRAGATPGELICGTGAFGLAAAGLMLAEHPELGAELPTEVAAPLRERLLRPEPRLEAGRALAAVGATAMIDVSDGLGADAAHLAAASGVGIEIELGTVPTDPGVGLVAEQAGIDRFELIASGGEDYELLCALPRGRVVEARRRLKAVGTALAEIGSVRRGSGVRLRLPGGRSFPVGGHDHLGR